MSSWGLAGTSPLQDFAEDPEDLIYKYLGGNWSITNPSHLTKAAIFLTTTVGDMQNRPNVNHPIWIWVQHFSLLSNRTLLGGTIGTQGLIQHNHNFNIHIFTRRFVQGLLFPDLGILLREVERLIYQYQEGQMQGIQQFVGFEVTPITEATDWGDSWTGIYRATCVATAQYQKRSSL